MAEHTPGPWAWYWREENGEAECGIFHEKHAGQVYSVARCPRYQKQDQWEKDAELIASAPTLKTQNTALAARVAELESALTETTDWLEHRVLDIIPDIDKPATQARVNMGRAHLKQGENNG